jgi:hypothetical protein
MKKHFVQMWSSSAAVALIAAIAACGGQSPTGTATDPAPNAGERPLAVVAASEASTRETGVAQWQVLRTEAGIRTLGLDAAGAVVSDIAFAIVGANTPDARVEADVQLPRTTHLTFGAKGLRSASQPLDEATRSFLTHMSTDLNVPNGAYDWACFWRGAAAGVACAGAVLEGGLNPVVDAACVVSLGIVATTC